MNEVLTAARALLGVSTRPPGALADEVTAAQARTDRRIVQVTLSR
ncbi:hypothetical protein [Pseudonocardia acidicola]|nr:hypothetical protein [Pseudonocardia acidicola]